MSCNGCRVLRKGCSETCVLRSCLHWIESPEAQGNATLFLAKFFGRSDLLSFISAVPHHHRPSLFQSLLFEACGRTVNPVNGALGLLSTGNWRLCQAAVETVLSGGVIRPISVNLAGDLTPMDSESCMPVQNLYYPSVLSVRDYRLSDLDIALPPNFASKISLGRRRSSPIEKRRRDTISLNSDESAMTTFGSGDMRRHECKERKLLNLFV